jgi:hypothetical protein
MFAALNATAGLAAAPGARPTARATLARGGNTNNGAMIKTSKTSKTSSPVSLTTAPPHRGATLRAHAGPSEDNPNFDPNDPMTWNASAGGGDGMMDFGAPVEDLMMLDDNQVGLALCTFFTTLLL